MLTQYKIHFTYLYDGTRIHDEDVIEAPSAKDALDHADVLYGDLKGFRVERIWKEIPQQWVEMDISVIRSPY